GPVGLVANGEAQTVRVIFPGSLFLGAIGALEVIWDVAGTLNRLMPAPHLIALLALAGMLAREKDAHMTGGRGA
ncbi:MAG TPA: alanine:cation symporter family protein, partial [Geminicoccaceae bacterium]